MTKHKTRPKRRSRWKLSEPKYGLVIAKDIMVPMRDQVRLAADVYLPAIDGKSLDGHWPTILQRTIFDKSNVHYAGHADQSARDGARLNEQCPVESGFQAGQFGAERHRSHVVAVLGRLADGVCGCIAKSRVMPASVSRRAMVSESNIRST